MNEQFHSPCRVPTVPGRIAGRAIAALLLMICTAASAQALFVEPVDFEVQQGCRATRSLKSKSGPLLNAGDVVVALGENSRTQPTHAYVESSAGRRWLRLSCGEYASAKPPFQDGNNGGGGGNADASCPQHGGGNNCLPFFDALDNPVNVGVGGRQDITPREPRLNAFDQAVVEMCGAPGRITGRTDFVRLMKSHPAVLADLMAYTDGRVFGNRAKASDPDAYLQDLVKAWYDVTAFDHILCGQPGDKGSIGGLHFSGRYQQLQTRHEACRLPNFGRNEVVPGVIYTMGVCMKDARGKWMSHPTKGYGLTLSAEDILKAATRAFAENPTPKTDSVACLLDVEDDQVRFTTVFVRRQSGIRTFYPDATPDSGTKRCKAPLKLDRVA